MMLIRSWACIEPGLSSRKGPHAPLRVLPLLVLASGIVGCATPDHAPEPPERKVYASLAAEASLAGPWDPDRARNVTEALGFNVLLANEERLAARQTNGSFLFLRPKGASISFVYEAKLEPFRHGRGGRGTREGGPGADGALLPLPPGVDGGGDGVAAGRRPRLAAHHHGGLRALASSLAGRGGRSSACGKRRFHASRRNGRLTRSRAASR